MSRSFVPLCLVLAAALLLPSPHVAAATTEFFPSKVQPPTNSPPGGWPTVWTALATYDVAGDGSGTGGATGNENDFVGDATNPAAYYASNAGYVFFRARVDEDGVTRITAPETFQDGFWIYVDKDGGASKSIDWAFAWDSQGNPLSSHGLELQRPAAGTQTYWSEANMDDVDGTMNSKARPDFNTLPGHSQDGYVRVIDSQSTTNFGATAFVDIAVSWDYLTATWDHDGNAGTPEVPVTNLNRTQSWCVAFATRHSSTDHGSLGTTQSDVLGISGSLGTSPIASTGWTCGLTFFVPEPASAVVLLGGVGLLLSRRRRSR